METDSSVEPPSITMYSRFGYCWLSTDNIVSSKYWPWLNDGVTTVIRGQGLPPGRVFGKGVADMGLKGQGARFDSARTGRASFNCKREVRSATGVCNPRQRVLRS